MLTAAPLRAPEEQLKLLTLHLRAERVGLLIVASPDTEAERALVEEVRLRLGDEVAVEEVTFAPKPVERLSLSHHLSTLPPQSGKAAVFVFGLDDLPLDARTTALNAMNWGRERLRWSGYTIVLWVRPGTPGDIGNCAPDFFSWRSDVFEFDIATDPVTRQQMLARLRLFAPAALDELRQRYCDYVVRTYQWLDFRGLLQLRNVVRLPLDEVFVPLQATTTVDSPLPSDLPLTSESTTPDDWRRYERQRIERRVALNDAVRQHRHLVVLGDPGSGKSTLLRFLALAFAQGRQQVQERLGISEDRLPILIPLSAFAEARKTQPDLPLATFLPRYFLEQNLPDFSPLFDDALSSGRALVLLDGLDEMLTVDDRIAVARAVVEFTSTHPTSRIVVTSRIAGYTPGMLPASFATFTVAPLDDDAIKQFAKQWSLAFEAVGLPSHTELSPEARHRAQLRADSLATAATGHPEVQRLATNPLLLTLLALIHYQGTRLPNHRTDLYRLCVEALAETWNLARSLSGRPIDLRLGERRLDEEFVVHILAPVAYWMHENKPTGLISREELEARVAEQFAADGSPGDARLLARDFVNLAREQMGLLVERAPDEFSFLHLSIQEYLTARFLSERTDGFERLKPRLHHPRWHEIVLLTAACLRGDYAAKFVERILNAHGRFDDFLQRPLVFQRYKPKGIEEIKERMLRLSDLLLAAHCVGNDVPVPSVLRQQIRDALFHLWRRPLFSRLREEITQTFLSLREDIVGFLLGLLQNKKEDLKIRTDAALALGQVGQGQPEVIATLLRILQDKSESTLVRVPVALALGQVGQGQPEVITTLLHILQDKSEIQEVRRNAIFALGQVGQGQPGVVTILLRILQDKSEIQEVRRNAIFALGQVGQGMKEIEDVLLSAIRDKSEDSEVRGRAAYTLGQAEQEGAEVVVTLLAVVQDQDEDEFVRWNAAEALSYAERGKTEITKVLLNISQDRNENGLVRVSAAETLEQTEQWQAEAIRTLVNIASNKDEPLIARWGAISALGHKGKGNTEVVKILMNIVRDESEDEWLIRRSTALALGQTGQGNMEVAKTLLHFVNDPVLHDPALCALWDVLAQAE